MKINKLLQLVKDQNFPKDEYAVFGSAILGVRGIREVPNIDLIVTDKLWNELLDTHKPDEEGFIRMGPIKISNWWFAPTRKDIPTMISEAEIIKDLPFVRLEEVRNYKAGLKREKDIQDVKLIDQFLKTISLDEPIGLGFETYEKFIDVYKKEVEKVLGNKIISLVLFGSVCRGQAKGSSDIDMFTFYDDKKVPREEVNKALIEIIINLRKSEEYLELTKHNIYPEVYPFLISKSKVNDLLWVFLDVTDHGIVIKDTNNFAQKLIEKMKENVSNAGGRCVKLPNGKWCWVLYKDFSEIKEGKVILQQS